MTKIKSRWASRIACVFAVLLIFCDLPEVHSQTRAEIDFFETKIRPQLVTHCYECHSDDAGKARGGLKLDSKQSVLLGGDSGPAVVPRSLATSLLYKSILYTGDDYQMPPKGKLPPSVIADFRKWIQMGAPDPRVTEISPAVESEIDIDAGRQFWAYQPPRRPDVPASKRSAWAKTAIDRFAIAAMDQHGLNPVKEAPAETLVRRLFFTLTGLPPTPRQLNDWTDRLSKLTSDETSSDSGRESRIDQHAYADLVDELLQSPGYGERWGRHWMDVARYADSTGGDQNNLYQHAWRYRDYVIDSFNEDKPFAQFIREQVAGDLLPVSDDNEWAENVIASGFLALGVKRVGEEDQQKFFADLVDEQIDTTMRAFLATTVACARCHDHKFDPIPQEDYYALAGIFRSTQTHYGLLKAQARQATTLLDLTGMGPPPGAPKLSAEELQTLIKERDDAARAVSDAMNKIRSGENVFRGTLRRLRSQRDETEAALQAFSNRGEPRVFAMGTQDRDHALPTRLLVRGELDKPAQHVPRGVPQVLCSSNKHTLHARSIDADVRGEFRNAQLGSPAFQSGSGRLHLAQWIASERNPLTARVIANRVWHWMFGSGIVRTVDDFGNSGDRPTHPELLDHLAMHLMQNDWSIKSLVREITLSRTWQLSSEHHDANFAIDPDNRYLWKMNVRRLEGEAIRDAMLAVSGELDLVRPTGTYLREAGEGGVGQNVFEPVIRSIETKTRSVYLPRVRSVLPEMLEVFDAPDASLVAGSRETTSSPLQALFMMNNPFVAQQAIALAKRIENTPPDQRITAIYQRVLARRPTAREVQLGAQFLNASAGSQTSSRLNLLSSSQTGSVRFGRRNRFSRQATSSGQPDPPNLLAAYCQALLCTAEFQTIQ
ncbi:MAG: PSD1 and planctomycete cytochrome C domain-containing protein [Rhodopirellula sp. JB044]|uniref:PSD1 and planctomycete cytochrome C domain-containing protein n=1 Tax=Rhodopirellula sp. JB044 TaxID=3342844 RepID=UPI003709E2E8